MNYEQTEKLKTNVAIQSAAFGAGAAVGAMTKNAASSGVTKLRKGQLANQIGQAMGAAVGNGGGLSDATAAGAAIVAAKITAAAAGAAAAAPVVAIAAAGYGLYKLFEWLEE